MAKGQKTGGRAMGTPNKLTKELRHVLKNLLHQELETLPELLSNMEAKDRLDVIIKLLPYAMPKVEAVHYTTNEPHDLDW